MSDWDNDDVTNMEATDALRQRARDAEAERDRLRAVVEAVREYRAVMKTRTTNLADGGPDLDAEGELSGRARALNRTIDAALEDVLPTWRSEDVALRRAEAAEVERDRLRSALAAIAYTPPGGTTLVSPPTVEHLQDVAKNALAQLDGSANIGDRPDVDLGQHEFAHPHIDHAGHQYKAMCSTMGHEDDPAVGDALTDETEEEPDDNRYPYCAECLQTLGADYEARTWGDSGHQDEDSAGGGLRVGPVGPSPTAGVGTGNPDAGHQDEDEESTAGVRAIPPAVDRGAGGATPASHPGDAGHQDEDGPETLPQLFARARTLLGQHVRVTVDRGPTVTAGRFLAVADDGSFVIEDDMDGSVHYCWPMLHIEAESVGERIRREGEQARRVVLNDLAAEREISVGGTEGLDTEQSPADRGAGAANAGAPPLQFVPGEEPGEGYVVINDAEAAIEFLEGEQEGRSS